jgi:hypothetical protein
MFTSDNLSARRRAAFREGFIEALISPVLLLSGAFNTVSSRRSANLGQVWRDVGRFIQGAIEQAGKRKAG